MYCLNELTHILYYVDTSGRVFDSFWITSPAHSHKGPLWRRVMLPTSTLTNYKKVDKKWIILQGGKLFSE